MPERIRSVHATESGAYCSSDIIRVRVARWSISSGVGSSITSFTLNTAERCSVRSLGTGPAELYRDSDTSSDDPPPLFCAARSGDLYSFVSIDFEPGGQRQGVGERQAQATVVASSVAAMVVIVVLGEKGGRNGGGGGGGSGGEDSHWY